MEGLQLKASPRSRRFGWGAGIVAFGTLLASAAGLVWGLLRPGYVTEIVDGLPVVDEAASPVNVEFASFAWFVMLSGVIGFLVGGCAYASAQRYANLWRMLFAIVVSVFASWALFTVGQWAAHTFGDVPHGHDLADGERFTVVPGFAPGVAWIVAPFAAALAYWMSIAVTAASWIGPVHGGRSPQAKGDIVDGREYVEHS